jgi:hypothetical protein
MIDAKVFDKMDCYKGAKAQSNKSGYNNLSAFVAKNLNLKWFK